MCRNCAYTSGYFVIIYKMASISVVSIFTSKCTRLFFFYFHYYHYTFFISALLLLFRERFTVIVDVFLLWQSTHSDTIRGELMARSNFGSLMCILVNGVLCRPFFVYQSNYYNMLIIMDVDCLKTIWALISWILNNNATNTTALYLY